MQETFEQIFKNFRSSDCLLQLEGIKEESLVIANQQVAVNTYWSSVQTARHGPNGVLPQVGKVVYIAYSLYINNPRQWGTNWNEVVTR